MIKQIMEAVSIPVMAKVRIGHTVEAQILQAVGVDYIDVRLLREYRVRVELMEYRNLRSSLWPTTSTTSASTPTRCLSSVDARTSERPCVVSLRELREWYSYAQDEAHSMC
jgi:hypothetical protein